MGFLKIDDKTIGVVPNSKKTFKNNMMIAMLVGVLYYIGLGGGLIFILKMIFK